VLGKVELSSFSRRFAQSSSKTHKRKTPAPVPVCYPIDRTSCSATQTFRAPKSHRPGQFDPLPAPPTPPPTPRARPRAQDKTHGGVVYLLHLVAA
jgi:hypothetical protein